MHNKTTFLSSLVLLLAMLPCLVVADELTQIIQQDLMTLGYDPGSTDGEATVATAVAISKFQSENGLPVTGEVSPQLAGVIKAAINQRNQSGSGAPAVAAAAAAAPASATPDPAALRAAQQACLQQKAAAAQESQQRQRGFGRLARAVGRTASRLGGGGDFAQDVASLSTDVYDANAIATDFKGAAEDLGLSESDIEACRNPL